MIPSKTDVRVGTRLLDATAKTSDLVDVNIDTEKTAAVVDDTMQNLTRWTAAAARSGAIEPAATSVRLWSTAGLAGCFSRVRLRFRSFHLAFEFFPSLCHRAR